DLVVAQLEGDRAPWSTPIVELHLEWPHDVRGRHSRGAWCLLFDEPTGESCPSRGEGFLEIAAELIQRPTSGRIEIPRESSASTETQCHRASAFDSAAGQHLPDDDQRHPYATTRSEAF